MAFTLLSIIVFSTLGILFSDVFIQLKSFIPFLLSLIMFFMGVTLTLSDFKRVVQKWKLILLGSGLQFLIMPLLAIAISKILELPLALTIGMTLVGSCPGGTASNVIVFLGKGNVALSISLTLFTTLLAPFFTPLLLELMLGQTIEIQAFHMFITIGKIVVLPLCLGITLNTFFQKISALLSKISSQTSSIGIALIIGCVLAINKPTLLELPLLIFLAVVLHNSLGFILGYFGAKIFTKSEVDSRTIAIEVGMQNSGLAVSLAQQFFASYQGVSLPGAIFSFWHNISGIGLASVFSQKKR